MSGENWNSTSTSTQSKKFVHSVIIMMEQEATADRNTLNDLCALNFE